MKYHFVKHKQQDSTVYTQPILKPPLCIKTYFSQVSETEIILLTDRSRIVRRAGLKLAPSHARAAGVLSFAHAENTDRNIPLTLGRLEIDSPASYIFMTP
jgi:hypothetical protein